MPSKKQRNALTASVAARFPKGTNKGDPLAGVLTHGNSFASVNSLSFGSVSKAKGMKRFAIK